MPSIGDQLLMQRSDLLTFPRKTVDLILEMQKEGWRGHRNAQGHVKMLAPDGKTHVMATQNPNSPTYLRSGYNQYKKKQGKEEMNSPSPKQAQKWPCARPTCPKVYATEQQLNTHIAVDHEKMLVCEYTNCFETRANKQKLSLHMTAKHGYVSPRKAQRKKQEAARADKEVLDQVMDEVKYDSKVDRTAAEVQRNEEIFYGEPKNSMANAAENVAAALQVPDGSKYDPAFIGKMVDGNVGVVRTDSMKAGDIVPDFTVHRDGSVTDNGESLKSLAAKHFNGTDLGDDHWMIPEFTTPKEGPIFVSTMSDPVKVRDGYETVQLKGDNGAPGNVEEVHFVDDRDSWVVDHSLLGRRRLNDMELMFEAAGLRMEIRVWKA